MVTNIPSLYYGVQVEGPLIAAVHLNGAGGGKIVKISPQIDGDAIAGNQLVFDLGVRAVTGFSVRCLESLYAWCLYNELAFTQDAWQCADTVWQVSRLLCVRGRRRGVINRRLS